MTAIHQRQHYGDIEKTLAKRLKPPKKPAWEREKALGLQFDFGEYRLGITNATGLIDEVIIKEDMASISTRVWDCSVVTSKWLEYSALKNRDLPNLNSSLKLPIASSNVIGRPLQVLELGAGTGLLSICLAKLGAAVLSTEYGRFVEYLQKNCVDNQVEVPNQDGQKWKPTAGQVKSCELDWYNAKQSLQSMFAEGQEAIFDLIIVTDCALTVNDSKGVLEMINKYATKGHTRVVVGLCKEREGAPYCVENIPKEFNNIERVANEDYHPEFQSSRHMIFNFEA